MTTITEMSTTTNRFFVLYTDKARLTLCVLAKNGARRLSGFDGYGLPYWAYSSSTLSAALDRLGGLPFSPLLTAQASQNPNLPSYDASVSCCQF